MKLKIVWAISALEAVSLCRAFPVCDQISTLLGFCHPSTNRVGTSSRASFPIVAIDSQVATPRQCRERLPVLLTAIDDSGGDFKSAYNAPESEKNKSAFSGYGQTSDPVKSLVSGLTNFFVKIADRPGKDPVTGASLGAAVDKPPLSIEELEAGIRKEYANNYLWTGDINEALYEVRVLCKQNGDRAGTT